MNHYLATYIDLIQSIAFITLFTITFSLVRKLFLDNKKDNDIETVKIKVDK